MMSNFTITGRTEDGRIVASEQTDLEWKARQIASGWEGSGLEVEILEQPASSSG